MHQFLSQNSLVINNNSLNSSSVNFFFEFLESFELLDSLEELSKFELLTMSERIFCILSIPSTAGTYILGMLSYSFKLMVYADALLCNLTSFGLVRSPFFISWGASCSFNSIYSWSIYISCFTLEEDTSTCDFSISCIYGIIT